MINFRAILFLVSTLMMCVATLPNNAQAQLLPILRNSCDPTIMSCAPGTAPPVAGPGSCGPGAAGGTCTAPGPATQASATGVDVGAGNPINVITGNKYQREVDMPALPGALGLEIVRHYNSAFSGPRHSNGIVGRGWKLSYETELYPHMRTVQIVQADGTRLIFNRNPANPSLCASGNPGDGSVRVVKTQRGEEYIWTWTNGRALSFNSQGKLVQIADPDGQFVSMQHDSSGMLLSVTDPQGRKLQLHYLDARQARAGDRFRGVQSIDSPVGRFTYEYGSALPKGATLGKQFLLANLVKVGMPNGTQEVSRFYHYEDARLPTLLTGISVGGRDADGKLFKRRIATYGYDADGKGILTVKGEPARLQLGLDGIPLNPAVLVAGTGVEQVTFDRSVGGRTVITNSIGKKTTYLYTVIAGQYRLLEVRGAGCSTCGESDVRYEYDAAGRLTATSKLSEKGDPITKTVSDLDKLGRTIHISQLDFHRGYRGSTQMQVRYEYDGDRFEPSLIARPSVVPGKECAIRLLYNQAGQVKSVTEMGWAPELEIGQGATRLERTTNYRYANFAGKSRLIEIDGPLPNGKSNSPADSDITTIEYDNLKSTTLPSTLPLVGRLAQFDQRHGIVTRVIAPGGRITTVLSRDTAGRPTRIRAPSGLELGLEFDSRGHLIRRSTGGISDHFVYNALGQLASARRSSGQVVNFTYGADGRVGDFFDTQNNRIRILRDTEGGLRARYLLNPDGTVAQQADLSRPTLDPEASANAAHISEPSENNRVPNEVVGAEDFPHSLLDPYNVAIRFAYDLQLRLVRFVDARGTSNNYTHDDFGRLVKTETGDAGTTIYHYDAADHLVVKVSSVGTANPSALHYRYDPVGRVTEQIGPEGMTSIRYGPSGRPQNIIYPAGEEQFTYDQATRLLSHTRLIDGHRFTTGYEYDENGRVRKKRLPDNQVLLYRYNGPAHLKAGLLAGIARQDLLGQTVLLDGLNDAEDSYRNQRYQLANGVEFVRELDQHGQISRIGSPKIWEEIHRHDSNGQLLWRAAVGAGGIRASYAYDPLGRMTGMAGFQTNARGFAYDGAGNLLAQLSGKNITHYRVHPNGNRINEVQMDGQTVQYAYNRAGSVNQIGDTTYSWDSQQRLIAIAQSGKRLAEYSYNSFGERIKKISYANNQKSVTYFFYDGTQLVAEAEPNNSTITVTRQYVWIDNAGASSPIALLQTTPKIRVSRASKAQDMIPFAFVQGSARADRSEVFAIVSDQTGAPRAVVDSATRTVWRADTVDYGAAKLPVSNILTLNLRGSSQYFDQETQLHYNYRRYLDPLSGRYLSVDPSGLAGGSNPYVFADNNPVNRLDPLGLQSKPAGAVSNWTFAERLKFVLERVAEKYPGELGDALKEMVSPTALATTTAIFSIWGASQFTPYGWAADIAVAGIGYLFMGAAVWDVIAGIYDSSSLILNAKCQKDLQDAGDILAKGLGKGVAAAAAGSSVTGAPKVAKLIKQMFKDGTVAQKTATAAAITEGWFGKFTPGRRLTGIEANADYLARHPKGYKPWSPLRVIETWLDPGTKIYMINLKSAVGPGGWATSRQFTSLAQARKELALLQEFKPSGSDCCVLQEYIVKSPIPVRQGTAGALTSRVPPYDSYLGGAQQWELLLDQSLVEFGGWEKFLQIGKAVELK